MFSDLANFVEGAAKAIQETVLESIGKESSKNDNNDAKEENQEKGSSLEDQINAVRSYFERAAAAQDGDKENEEEHLKYATMKPFKEVGAAREDILEHVGPVLYQGSLFKQGRRVNIWRERYFLLRESGLAYYSHKPTHEQVQLISAIGITGKEAPEEIKKKIPKERGALFFADIMTVTGRVVDDLPMLQNPWLGGREHAFCLHTGHSMYVLAANTEEQKNDWIKKIEETFSEFLNKQVRKVAMMELSWEIAGEAGVLSKKPKKSTLKKGETKEKKAIMKKTLERTQSRFMAKDIDDVKAEKQQMAIVYGKAFADKQRKADEELEIRRKVAHANAQARSSINRLKREDHRRISKRSVDNLLGELTTALEKKFEQQVVEARERYILQKKFHAWIAHTKYSKNEKKKKGKTTLTKLEERIQEESNQMTRGRSGFFTKKTKK